jgi:hypothetical protein
MPGSFSRTVRRESIPGSCGTTSVGLPPCWPPGTPPSNRTSGDKCYADEGGTKSRNDNTFEAHVCSSSPPGQNPEEYDARPLDGTYRRSAATHRRHLQTRKKMISSDQGRGRRTGIFKPAEEETFRNGVQSRGLFPSDQRSASTRVPGPSRHQDRQGRPDAVRNRGRVFLASTSGSVVLD